MQSKAATVDEYLAELPDDRRAAIDSLRQLILKNLDRGFEESMQYGMIGYCVPHRIFPAGYHCDPKLPLPFCYLASQKNYMSFYCMSLYCDDETWFREAWAKTGKKLDMGKCCVRFKRLEDLALDVIAEAIKRITLKGYVDNYVKTLEQNKVASAERSAARKAAKKTELKRASTKTATKKATAKKASVKKAATKKAASKKSVKR